MDERIQPIELELDLPNLKVTSIYLTHRSHQPFWSFDDEDIERRLRRLQNSRPEILFTQNELQVNLSTLSPSNQIYWAEVDNNLVYEADIKIASLKDGGGRIHKMPFQSSVWRDTKHPQTAGIPTDCFWHCFLNSPSKVIGSDLEQTREGRAFWQYRIREALAKGHEVSINRLTETSTPVRRVVENREIVTRLKDLTRAYSSDPAEGPLTFLLIQK